MDSKKFGFGEVKVGSVLHDLLIIQTVCAQWFSNNRCD